MTGSLAQSSAPWTMQFTILQAAPRVAESLGPRLGRLAMKGRKAMETPSYVGITSRGVIPHLSQDVMRKHTSMHGVYVALEDFIERASINQKPPLLSYEPSDGTHPLRGFIALPEDQLLILGARRTPPVSSPTPNQQTSIMISTSFGFSQLKSEEYVEAAAVLKPDIVVGLGDIPFGTTAGSRRIERMALRTERWLKELLDDATEGVDEGSLKVTSSVFAPILPVTREQQSLYLEILADQWRDQISGLAIYDTETVPELAETLKDLPMLSLSEAGGPAELLRQISLGLDIFTAPFVSQATDSGIALDFRFASAQGAVSGTPKPLGSDMWLAENSTDLSPFVDECQCYACSLHHRAYVHHLLSAKEMLAWVLLQIHNFHILDNFFSEVRSSISRGSFERDHEVFLKVYEREIPMNAERGPRIRGYQLKSEGRGEPKKNPRVYNTLDDVTERYREAQPPDAESNSEKLENQGFAEIVKGNTDSR